MPAVTVTVISSQSEEWKQTVLRLVRDTTMEAFVLQPAAIFVRLCAIKPEHFLADESRTDKFTLVELAPLTGRTDDEKRTLVRRLNEELGALGVPPRDVQVIIYDIAKNNRGSGGKLVCDI